MIPVRYPIRIDSGARFFVAAAFGAVPGRAWVTLDNESIAARFGWWHLRVRTDQVTGWRIEGPWHWATALGVRRSIRGGDISFAGSSRGGVRLDLADPIRWMRLSVSVIYLGVEDLEGFAAGLTALDIPGTDARR